MGAAFDLDQEDHRRSPRRRALRGGKLVFAGDAFTTNCVVRDISDKGARVKVPDGQPVPNDVYLLDLRDGIAFESRVVWKRHPEIGLKFVNRYELQNASTPYLKMLRSIWIENCERRGV